MEEGLTSRALGVPIRPHLPEPLPPGGPGYGWKLSDKARRDIEAIERHMRLAQRRLTCGKLSIDSERAADEAGK